jgi:Fe-S cluster assembly ATP-binding protein
MSKNSLKIEGLTVEVEGKKILDGFTLTVNPGETHAIMGPNGSGKSTLCYALMGHPKYKITSGKATFDGHNLFELRTDARARLGIFLGFQYPREVAGITFGNFLRQASNIKRKTEDNTAKPFGAAEYFKVAGGLMDELKMDRRFIGRGVNEGFSGGEKKRAEIVQMKALEPKLALLDEIDSGLDIDALKDVATGVSEVKEKTGMGLLLITHYQRLLHYLKADFVHVMVAGKIVQSGGMELVEELEKEGYKNYLNK